MKELWKYEGGTWIFIGEWSSFDIMVPGANYRIKEDGKWVVALHKLSD